MTHNNLCTLIFRNFKYLTHALLREKFWAPNDTGPGKIGLNTLWTLFENSFNTLLTSEKIGDKACEIEREMKRELEKEFKRKLRRELK